MVDLTKIKRDINWLIEQVKCLFTFALSATQWTPAHDSSTGNKYPVGILVWHEGFIYKAITANNGVPTSNVYFWKKIGEGSLIGQEQTDWNSTGGDNFLRNKPTALSDFENDLSLSEEIQNNTWREIYLGACSPTLDGPTYDALFNVPLTVTGTENIMLTWSVFTIGNEFTPASIYKFKFARGKGEYLTIPHVVNTDIIFESYLTASSLDIGSITERGNTTTIPLGDITGTTIVDHINNTGPYSLTLPEQIYLFLYENAGETYLYQFIGVPGEYGLGETVITTSDLLFITSSLVPVVTSFVQEIIPTEAYVGKRIAPTNGDVSGYLASRNVNGRTGYEVYNPNTGNEAVAAFVTGNAGYLNQLMSMQYFGAGYYQTYLRNRGAIYSTNTLFNIATSNGDFIWRSGLDFNSTSEVFKVNNDKSIQLIPITKASVTGADGKLIANSSNSNRPAFHNGTDWKDIAYLSVQTTGVVIDFTDPKVFNTASAPATANITNDLTLAKTGIVQKIYHNHTSTPTIPGGWVLIGGEYVTEELNIIYAEWCESSRVEYWITQEQ